MDLSFKLGKGIGPLTFSTDEERTIEIIGEPENIEIDQYNPGEFVRSFQYGNDFQIVFSYYNNDLDNVKFFLNHLIIDNQDIARLRKEDALNLIESIHIKNNTTFKYEHQSTGLDEYYIFPNIGITLWFESDNINDICVEKIA